MHEGLFFPKDSVTESHPTVLGFVLNDSPLVCIMEQKCIKKSKKEMQERGTRGK